MPRVAWLWMLLRRRAARALLRYRENEPEHHGFRDHECVTVNFNCWDCCAVLPRFRCTVAVSPSSFPSLGSVTARHLLSDYQEDKVRATRSSHDWLCNGGTSLIFKQVRTLHCGISSRFIIQQFEQGEVADFAGCVLSVCTDFHGAAGT